MGDSDDDCPDLISTTQTPLVEDVSEGNKNGNVKKHSKKIAERKELSTRNGWSCGMGVYAVQPRTMVSKPLRPSWKKKGKFDYILLETTGLADPSPIASIFWMDDELGSDLYLDSIITLFDAKYGFGTLTQESQSDKTVFIKQIACADVILLNKIDLLDDPSQQEKITNQIQSINSSSLIIPTSRAIVDFGPNFGLKFLFRL
ncbi:unnamed protein product [Lepeophtheirus salmonis]|uniref:(salmon louse) hypothetical protein n=1 Tax=Lepeophtheirus salmonis TaxID=72036 RepID=A0A7R8CIF1_LEPSM|nr:unnamed protein product [Lepeophtheirus salmonis]CAF2831787.1 unnamed protein product [Lepeophtheirus salmonis]